MNDIEFKACFAAKEIDLNAIAAEFGSPKKYTWEEALILKGEPLSRILNKAPAENQAVYVYSFGSVVSANCSESDNEACLAFLQNIQPAINTINFKYYDNYTLHISDGAEIELTDKYVIVPEYELYCPELISTVIAKSVALEKIERDMTDIIDDIEPIIDNQQSGKLRVRERRLATTRARISRYQYNTIAYIMILDKPDITWVKGEAGVFYDLLSEFFELNDRYEILTKKTELLNNTLDGVESSSRLLKSAVTEYLILLLILAEVILMALELIK